MKSEILPVLARWYALHARDLPWRRTRDAYRIWISEIMLQQTRVNAVIPYYERFLQCLPDVSALAQVDDEVLHKLWEGLGYYSRAKNLKRAAGEILTRFGGCMPLTYDELLTLPGIGDYTAGAVASIAGGQCVPAVDGNVLRVWTRLQNDARSITDPATKAAVRADLADAMQQAQPMLEPWFGPDKMQFFLRFACKNDCIVQQELHAFRTVAGSVNAALMELGATVCIPGGKPKCEICPVAGFCQAAQAGTQMLLPVKQAKKARRVEEKTVFVLLLDGMPLGMKRPDSGLLAGLWQLPESEGILDENTALQQLSAWRISPVGPLLFYKRKHVFTHVEWRMQVCALTVHCEGALPEGWVPLDADKALPTAYRVCLPG